MIVTECPSCDDPIIFEWEGGPHGWFPARCDKCGDVMWVETTMFGGLTVDSEHFFDKICKPEDRERMQHIANRVARETISF